MRKFNIVLLLSASLLALISNCGCRGCLYAVCFLEDMRNGFVNRQYQREVRAFERSAERKAKELRGNLQAIVDDPELLCQWNAVEAAAVVRLLQDPTTTFTEEQLLALDAIWHREDAVRGRGEGGWSMPCSGLWLRPEWSLEHLAKGCESLQRATTAMRREEWLDYAVSTNVPDDSLHILLATGRCGDIARSNLMSRVVRDDVWRALLRDRYRMAEWASAATNLATQADIDDILGERDFFYAKIGMELFTTPDAARAALVEKCGLWNTRCTLVCRTPGDTAIGERCYADETGPTPPFVAAVRANVLITARVTPGSTPRTLQAADWLDRELCKRLGIRRDGTTPVHIMESLRYFIKHGFDKREVEENERAKAIANAATSFRTRLGEMREKNRQAFPDGPGIFRWNAEGRLEIGGNNPMCVALKIAEGKLPGLEDANPEERARFCFDAAAYASATAVSAYEWDAFARPLLSKAFSINPSLRAEAEALRIPEAFLVVGGGD